MNKNKIFISLDHYDMPNPPAFYGLQLAKKLERPAYFFGVEKVPISPDPIAITGAGLPTPNMANMTAVKNEAQGDMKDLYETARQMYADVEFDVEIGFPEENIIAKTDKVPPYMVVLEGNNELTTLHEWFGTYETRLAENINAPVLILPKNNNWKTVNRIVYVMDLDDQKVMNMRFLTDVARELRAEIAVVLLSTEQNEKEMAKYNLVVSTLRTLLGYDNVNFHQIFTQDSANTIEKLIERVNADWFAFEHKSRSFFERVLDDYNTKRLVLQSEIPVLVF